MFRNWKALVLLILLVGPVLAYVGFGSLWLKEHGWLFRASMIWLGTGIVFTVLASRWTSPERQLLPPIDWDAPSTFSQRDRYAWGLVQEEANHGESISMDELSQLDIYIETGKRLAQRLAAHYHPLSTDPIEHVPVVELLTALELAADDLNQLCRQVPGGDMVTPAHWKRAVQAANLYQKANAIYTYLMPIVQPLYGLARLGSQKLMVNPAWKNLQQNAMRWFYVAFVNRLGTHLIELYSGRLVIGADQYRKLTRRSSKATSHVIAEMDTLQIAVAGARKSEKGRLVEALDRERAGDLGPARARLVEAGLDVEKADRLRDLIWVIDPEYVASPGEETARERATRRAAVEDAVDSDLLLLVIDGGQEDVSADVAFARAWEAWYADHQGLEIPPALVVMTGADRPEWGGDWKPPYDWARGRGARELAVRARLDALRAEMPARFAEIIPVGLKADPPFGVREHLLPALATDLHQAERVALIRHLHEASARSKARRLVSQVGRQARGLWDGFKSKKPPKPPTDGKI